MKHSNKKMNMRQLMTVTLLLFFLLIPLSVKADQQYCVQYNIPNVTSPLTPNQTVTVQATLKNCGSLKWTKNMFTLSYHWYSGSNAVVWDGVRSLLPQDVSPGGTVSLTAKVTAPGAEGTYTLKWDMCHEGVTWFSAKGNPTKDQTVEVKTSLDEVVAIVYFSALVKAMLTPNIDLVFPTPPLNPEGEYYISGSQFGDKPGQVRMTLPSGKTTNLVVQLWWNGLIRVHVPPVTGEKDGSASIQVETSNNFTSNKVSVNFEATRDIIQLPKNLVQADCADPAGSLDGCMETDSTFDADHQSWCCFQGDNDTDKFWTKAPLKNGWVIKDYSFMYGDSCNTIFCSKPGGNFNVKTFSGKGTPAMQVTIDWSDKLDGGIFYSCDVYIVGPKGVPYQ